MPQYPFQMGGPPPQPPRRLLAFTARSALHGTLEPPPEQLDTWAERFVSTADLSSVRMRDAIAAVESEFGCLTEEGKERLKATGLCEEDDHRFARAVLDMSSSCMGQSKLVATDS